MPSLVDLSQRHAEHLVGKGRWHQAVLHLIAARQFNAALKCLLHHELYDMAFLFKMACAEVSPLKGCREDGH